MDQVKTSSEEPVNEPEKVVEDHEQFVLDTLLDEKGTEKEPSEPEVKVEEAPPPSTTEPKVEDDLSRALSTIAELQTRVTELSQRVTTPESLRAEPNIETVEYFPGVHVAKDRTKRPIQVTDDDLIKAGWNNSPAEAIEVLGNTFYQLIVRTLPQIVESQREQKSRVVEEGQNRRSRFEELFPDLKAHGELMEIVERNERKSGVAQKYKDDPDKYFQAIGKAGRARVAQLRGMSIDQYELSIKGSGTTKTVTTESRQRTTPQSSRSTTVTKQSEQQALLEDTLKDL